MIEKARIAVCIIWEGNAAGFAGCAVNGFYTLAARKEFNLAYLTVAAFICIRTSSNCHVSASSISSEPKANDSLAMA